MLVLHSPLKQQLKTSHFIRSHTLSTSLSSKASTVQAHTNAHLHKHTHTHARTHTTHTHTHTTPTHTHSHHFWAVRAEGRSKFCLVPPPLDVWNLRFCMLSAIQGESKWVVSWSKRWVYFVRPDRPKFFTWANKSHHMKNTNSDWANKLHHIKNTDSDGADKMWKTLIMTGQTKRGKHRSDWADKMWKTLIMTGQTKRGKHRSDWADKTWKTLIMTGQTKRGKH